MLYSDFLRRSGQVVRSSYMSVFRKSTLRKKNFVTLFVNLILLTVQLLVGVIRISVTKDLLSYYNYFVHNLLSQNVTCNTLKKEKYC